MRRLEKICRLDCGSGLAMLNRSTGTKDFIYSQLDTQATASGGVIFCLTYVY